VRRKCSLILEALIIVMLRIARILVYTVLRLDQIGAFNGGIPRCPPYLFDELIDLFVGLPPLLPLLKRPLILLSIPRDQYWALLIYQLYFLCSNASMGLIAIIGIIGQPPDLQRIYICDLSLQ
jgi:hypothetical protein